MVALTGVLSGIVPALRSTRRGFVHDVRTSDRGASASGAGSGRLQRVLVAVEVALAMALMAGGALMIRSLAEQLNVAPGFRPDGVLAARIDLSAEAYTPEARVRFVRQLVARLESTAGIAAVALASDAPLRGRSSASTFAVDGRPDERIRHYRHRVTSGYFRTLGIPLISGRGTVGRCRCATRRDRE